MSRCPAVISSLEVIECCISFLPIDLNTLSLGLPHLKQVQPQVLRATASVCCIETLDLLLESGLLLLTFPRHTGVVRSIIVLS